MKTHLLFLCASVFALSSTAQTAKNDLSIGNLKGRVKSVNKITYEGIEKFGELEKGGKIARDFREFNSAGFELQHVMENFEEDGEKFVRTTRYDNSNRAIEMKEEQEGEAEVTKLKYNSQGHVELLDVLDGKGNLQYRQKNKYNAQGLLAQADTYEGDGSLGSKTVHIHNALKQLIKEEWYDAGEKLTRLSTYAYDSRSNIIEETSVNYERPNPKPYVKKYAYNDQNLKTEERNSIAGLDRKDLLEYNTQGDLVRKLDAYGEEERKTYTYDQQNNWIKCVTTTKSPGKTAHQVIERLIRYF